MIDNQNKAGEMEKVRVLYHYKIQGHSKRKCRVLHHELRHTHADTRNQIIQETKERENSSTMAINKDNLETQVDNLRNILSNIQKTAVSMEIEKTKEERLDRQLWEKEKERSVGILLTINKWHTRKQ